MLGLLAFLARRSGRTLRREEAADLLWGEGTTGTARQSLRQALSDLREVVGPGLAGDSDSILLAPGVVELDLTGFEQAMRAGHWQSALDRWHGDFLPGLEDLGGPAWRAWVDQERAAVGQLGATACERLINDADSRGDWGRALALAQRWRTLLPGDPRAVAAEDRLLPLAGRGERTREVRGLATPVLTGREAELDRLGANWVLAQRGEGRIVLVEGDPGLGTSRLLQEFARAARRCDGAVVVEARGYASERAAAHALVRSLLDQLVHAPGLSAAPPSVLASLRSIAPTVGERFPSVPVSAGEYPVPEAVHRSLADVAAEGPVALVIDDAAAADERSREVLQHLVRHPPGGCLVVLGGRPDGWAEVADDSDLRQAATHLERVVLGGLTVSQLESLLHSMAAFEPDTLRVLAGQLHREVGGAPGSLIEMVRQLVEQGHLAMDDAGRWSPTLAPGTPLPVPGGLAGRTRARLTRLGAAARRLLDAAAVLGEPMPQVVIRTVAGLDEAAAAEGFAELLARRWLRAPPAQAGWLEGTERGALRVVYTELDPAHRRQLHHAALAACATASELVVDRDQRQARHRAAAMPLPPRRRRVRGAVGVVAAIALGLAALVVSRRGPPEPGTVRVVMADVDDRTPQRSVGGAVASAALISLRESGRILVISRDQVQATLRRMGRAGADSALDLQLAREVAERENLDAILGLVVDSGPAGFTVAGQLVDPVTGAPMTEAEGQADTPDGAIAALDGVIAALRRGAGESRRAVAARRRLPASTTGSLEALRAYADGRAAWRLLDARGARLHWARAVDLDSNFAMALLALSDWHYWSNDRANGEAYLARARALGDRLTDRERLALEATVAQRLGTPEEAVARLALLATTYPDRDTWSNLAAVLMRQQRCAEAIPAGRRALAFDTLFAVPWITIATCHQYLDQPDSALAAYAMAEVSQPGVLYQGSLNQEWGRAWVQSGNLAAADSVFRRMAAQGDPGNRAFGIRSLGFMAMRRGEYRDAAAHFLEAAVQSRARDARVSELRNRVLLAEALLTSGDRRRAGDALDRARALLAGQVMEPAYYFYVGHALIRAGAVPDASELLQRMGQGAVATNPQDRSARVLLEGWLNLATGRPEAALAAVAEDRYLPFAAYRLALQAEAFSALGQPDSALAAARRLAGGFHFGSDAEDEWLRGWLRVGRLAEAVGDPAEARRAYSAYLERWPGGDADLPEVREAAAALVRLGGQR